ncbi:MAG: 3-hydroxyacyl-ACP dehydratase FabZ family protein [Phycisphaerae bacterium]
MKFAFVDALVSFESAKRITVIKQVSLAEEYLADHFPDFPVLPGVLMLETAVEAAAWLVREWDQFQHSLVVLRAARGIRYGTFVAPGNVLRIEVEVIRLLAGESEFKIRGMVGATSAIQGRLELAHKNIADDHAALSDLDGVIIKHLRRQWVQLQRALAA